MLTPLTPNLLTAVCLFCECGHSPARFFNYTLPCVLSEYIIQNEMHLENIIITNAHHYSHNFNLTWCLFWFFVSFCIFYFILYFVFLFFYQFLLKWQSDLFQLGNHTLTVSNVCSSPPLTNSRLLYLPSEGEILAALVPLHMMKKTQSQQSQSDFTM